jgi:4-amino-4-deoxy-L-arabinose transferase-like glycosyltransferase
MHGGSRAKLAVGGLALLDLTLHLVAAPRYGFHRDELYLLACAQRLDWGSLDHAPLTPALSWLMAALGGAAPALQRVPDAVAGAATVWLAGLAARRLGGGGRAQVLAAGAVLIAPVFIYAAGVHGTNALDQLCWTALGYVVVHALTAQEPSSRPWLWSAVVLGLGLLNKYTVLLWAAALAGALLVTFPRASWRPGRAALTVLLVALIILPTAAWQHLHGWPAVDFLRAHHQAASRRWSPLAIVAQQALLLGPFSLALALHGLGAGLRRGARSPERVLALAFVLVAAFVLVVRGKPYYLASAYPLVLAMGAVASERLVDAAPRLILASGVVVGALAFALTLPIVPSAWRARWPLLLRHPDIAQFADWPEVVAQIARAYHSQPAAPDVRRGILTDSYGTAAAIERWGAAHGLPFPRSGANGYHVWSAPGAGDEPDELLASGYSPALLSSLCRSLQPVGQVTDARAVDNRFDFPRTLYLCRGLKRPLREAWGELRRFD